MLSNGKTNYTKWVVDKSCKVINANVVYKDDVLEISFKKDASYSFAKAYKRIDNVIENSIYEAKIDTDVFNAICKVVYTWKDKNNKNLATGYLINKQKFISPKSAVSLELSIIGYSISGGNILIRGVEVFYLKRQDKRQVKIVSIPLKYKGERTLENNLSTSLLRIDEAAKEKPDLILLTECFYSSKTKSSLEESSLYISDLPILKMCEKAKEYKTYLNFSFYEVDKKGYYYNTALLIDRMGKIIGKYRKSHLTLDEIERGIVPGNSLPIFNTDFGKIGIAICWDLFFPETARVLQLSGAEIVLHPTLGFDLARVKTRATDCGYFIAVSTAGEERETCIIDPSGKVISTAKENGYAIAEIDLNKQYYEYWLSYPSYTVRNNIYMHERRQDLYYKGISETDGNT